MIRNSRKLWIKLKDNTWKRSTEYVKTVMGILFKFGNMVGGEKGLLNKW